MAFRPDIYIENYQKLNIDLLIEKKIKVLACDLDNTLVAHDQANNNEEVLAFIEMVEAKGIKFVIMSNNNKKRVTYFLKDTNIDYFYWSVKPLRLTFRKLLKRYNVNKSEVALMGDQLLTDILGANSFGITSILVDPVAQKDSFNTRINRFFERLIKKSLSKKNQFRDGEYYE